MSSVLLPPYTVGRVDPFVSGFVDETFDPFGTKKTINEGAKSIIDSISGFFTGEFDSPKFKAPSPNAPLGGGGRSGGSGAGDDDKPPGRPARFSDFKTAAKIAAGGAAAAGAGLALNETAKQLGQTASDAAAGIGEAFDNAAASLGDLFDPLGITDPEQQKNLGKLVILGLVALVGIGIMVMVVKK